MTTPPVVDRTAPHPIGGTASRFAAFRVPLRDVSIRAKLTAALGLTLALIVGLGVLTLVELHVINHEMQQIRSVRLPQIETLEDIKRVMSEHRLQATRKTQTANYHHLADIGAALTETQKAVDTAERRYRASIGTPEERALIDGFRSSWNDYNASLRSIGAKLEDGELSSAMREFNTIARDAVEKASQALERLLTISRERSRMAAAHAETTFRLALLLTIPSIVAAAVLALCAMVWVSRNISSPLLRVAEAMGRLTAGDESTPLHSERCGNDEIGVLIAAVAGYRDALASRRQFAADAEREHQRLQAAISNMPVGLSMFDAAEKLVICNNTYHEMYALPDDLTRPGTSLSDLLSNDMMSKAFRQEDLNEYRAEIAESVISGRRTLRLFELVDGRTISTIVQATEDGGWVTVHEDITERRDAEAQINHLARHDALTGLPNRVLFGEKITEAMVRVRRGEKLAILCLDLDHFKNVNDTLGHPAGDRLLRAVAERLKECVRETDTVARLGGDEFAIIQLGGAVQPKGASVLAERIIETINAPYEIDGNQVIISTSIGITISPNDGMAPDVLLKNSDMALYCAKENGRRTYCCFDPVMDALIQARNAMEGEIRLGLTRGEFMVFYQPVIDLKRHAVTSFEALLRWQHPTKGVILPATFIPVAEDTGLIIPIGEWVLRQACYAAQTWPDDIKVAVNVSPTQFKSRNLVKAVVGALELSGLTPTRLELEITEGVLLVDTPATLETLHQLRALGVRIAMDDFGTGYSSLSYLHKFPFDRIKIDRSFVAGLQSEGGALGIVRAVAGLGASLHIATTAEGVETEEQAERLCSEGYDALQGYFFGRPCPAGEVGVVIAGLRQRLAPGRPGHDSVRPLLAADA